MRRRDHTVTRGTVLAVVVIAVLVALAVAGFARANDHIAPGRDGVRGSACCFDPGI